ncbi:23S rRNA (cytidine(2498)-2'-O)-methyltransferase RlmM [Alteromonas sp. ASW11-19]|uniref:Ribosomal RNA large subunit methyltransferase M n=1 Tax=Alteromonas salexigens TaxID=2982530 RepID=A0ABT2VL95_9ALTE|nr:23S rRNA (cytidine(2498)-2'-O)-methyltransferase RlmM [Alteromonas salexigens]MCU7553845.1 23S rRNA (cytidine(2498)-2'-O)-methyltransferase RlmM [Alteromonas salexigens]
MTELLAYCRSGYEKDTASELTALTAEQGVYGYPVLSANSGYVSFMLHQAKDLHTLAASIPVAGTVFPRQLVAVTESLTNVDKQDRISPVLSVLREVVAQTGQAGNVVVEHADTDDGKQLAKFCRKFVVPLRQALRGAGILSKKDDNNKPVLHVFFTEFDACKIGYSLPAARSPWPMGICRLKFPADAPSRSTLKLEEAIVSMLSAEEREQVLRAGGRAVDLGACPGGWTYQLVQREMYVEAVDNGLVDDSLMRTGLVGHAAADGFTYQPEYGRVDLLVCDMIEQPDRVAKLMGDWLVKGLADHAIFNLKLPMKKRYETVTQALTLLKQRMAEAKIKFSLQARHLYHDRDEITVTVIRQE